MKEYKRYLPLVLFLILLVVSFLIVKPLLLALFLGALLAYIFYPLYNLISAKIKNKTFPALLICIVFLLIFGTISFFLVQSLVQESYILFIVVKQRLAIGLFSNCQNSFCQFLQDFSNNPEVSSQIQVSVKAITNWVITKGSEVLVSLPRIFLSVFVIFFSMFYFLRDGKVFVSQAEEILGMKRHSSFIIGRLKEIMHGIIYGYVIVALIQGALGALGFYLFGVSSPLFWGVVMAFLALIPMVGTGFVWIPASAFIFLDGVFQGSQSLILKGVGLFVYCLIFVASLDNVIRPRIIGKRSKIHPLIITIGVMGGLYFFGVWGVIIGPLLVSLAYVVIDYFLLKKEPSTHLIK